MCVCVCVCVYVRTYVLYTYACADTCGSPDRTHPKKALKDFSTSLLLNDSRKNIAAYLHRGILYAEMGRYCMVFVYCTDCIVYTCVCTYVCTYVQCYV